jgi:hypothetical protein
LIGQGANDPRVKQAEAEQIVAAIENNGGRVTYALYTDESTFGGCEPAVAKRHPGSSAVVKVIGR